MPKDIQQRILEKYGEVRGRRIIDCWFRVAFTDFSEASWDEIMTDAKMVDDHLRKQGA